MNLKSVLSVVLFLQDHVALIRVIDMTKKENAMITILLDVDGVLNASKAGWSRAPSKGWAYASGQSWKMQYEPQVMAKLRALHSDPAVRILWATTWVGDTDQLEYLFKLPALLSAGATSMSISDKQKAALEVARAGDKVIWIDDQAIPLSGAIYEELILADALLIRPASNRGLRPEHFDKIDAFVLSFKHEQGAHQDQ